MTSREQNLLQRPNLTEVVLIVGSVLLALWFDELREDWDRGERAAAWELTFVQELCDNSQRVRESLGSRRANLEQLARDPSYEFAQPFPSIRNVSWEVLRSSDIMRAIRPELVDLAARLYASQSQYRSTQPQFYLSANMRRIAQSFSDETISRSVLTDAYRGFVQLETEMVILYAEVEQQLGIACHGPDNNETEYRQ